MKHCILVKWNKSVSDKHALVEEVKLVFNKLLEVDGIKHISYHEGCVEKENRFDLFITIEMDKSVLPVYDESAAHHEWKEKYGKYVENKVIFDYEE